MPKKTYESRKIIPSQDFSPIKAIKADFHFNSNTLKYTNHTTRIIGTTLNLKLDQCLALKSVRKILKLCPSQCRSTLFGFWSLDFAFALINSFASWASTLVMNHTCFEFVTSR